MARQRSKLLTGELNVNQRRIAEANRRKEEFLGHLTAGHSMTTAREKVGVTKAATAAWRRDDPGYRRRLETIKLAQRNSSPDYDGSFVSFRRHYLGMDTTWFQAAAAEAIESAPAGSVTLILWPPGHGKTTLLEDWCTYKLVRDGGFRITVGSAKIDHSRKVLERVRNRLTSEGPTPKIHKDFGPFEPQQGRGTEHVWSATRFNTLKKMSTDERDYSMSAVGLTANVQGTRADLMVLDDVQSLTNLEQTDKFFDIIVQDFLSRPNMFGRTVIIGTRVGEFDVYRKLIEKGIPHKVITFPAYNRHESPTWPAPVRPPDPNDESSMPPAGVIWLWPDVYKAEAYAQLRWRIGEQAWARNYMQDPEAATRMTFPEEVTSRMCDETRGHLADPGPLDGGNKVPVVLNLDPAIGGGNGILAGAMRPDRFDVLDCRLDYDLTSYGQIMSLLDDMAWRFTTATSFIAEVVIEDKAFQRGLLTNDQLVEMQRRFGFRIVPNTTGGEKADPDIGIPALPYSIRRGEITIPAATEEDLDRMRPLLNHLHQWRPGVPGNRLAQDMVMVLWFGWRRWRAYRDTPLHHAPSPTQFHHRPSPLRPRGYRPLAVR